MKRTIGILLAAALSLLLAAPGLAAAAGDPLPPVANAEQQMSDAARETAAALRPAGNASGEASSAEPSGKPSGEASDESPDEADLLPLTPGTYEGSDGSVLKVKADGTCTYETTVSGKVNGSAMSGRLTFHGTVEGGEFSFTKVTFFGMDLTDIAASLGYTDASPWETAAAIIYAGGQSAGG